MVKKTFISNKQNNTLLEKYIIYYKAKKPDSSKHTIRSKKQALTKLADFLENNTKHKSLKNPSEEEMIKFFNNSKYVPNGSHNLMGLHIIPFYRWINNLDKHTRPNNMKWFETSSKRTKLKNNDPHRKDKLLITTEDYEKIINNSNDTYNQWKAIWETYWLSGFRPEELTSMNIEDVKEDKDHIVEVSCPKSKTYPRTIPLTEYPYNLMQYLGNHPKKNNKTAPLWFITKGATKLQKLDISSIQHKFRELKNTLNLKPTLTIKSFRKTRATILFSDKEITDKKIGQFMGWQPSTVIFRRQEYELSNTEDLKKVICKKPIIPKSFDSINKDLTQLENKYIPIIKKQDKKIKEQEKEIKKLNNNLKENKEILATNREDFKIKINDMNEKIHNLINKTFVENQEIIIQKMLEELDKTIDDKTKQFVKKGYKAIWMKPEDIKLLNKIIEKTKSKNSKITLIRD